MDAIEVNAVGGFRSEDVSEDTREAPSLLKGPELLLLFVGVSATLLVGVHFLHLLVIYSLQTAQI